MEEILSSPTVPTKCKLRNSDNELTFSDRHHTYLKGPASKREIVLIKTQNTTSDDIYQTLLAAADGLFSLEEYHGVSGFLLCVSNQEHGHFVLHGPQLLDDMFFYRPRQVEIMLNKRIHAGQAVGGESPSAAWLFPPPNRHHFPVSLCCLPYAFNFLANSGTTGGPIPEEDRFWSWATIKQVVVYLGQYEIRATMLQLIQIVVAIILAKVFGCCWEFGWERDCNGLSDTWGTWLVVQRRQKADSNELKSIDSVVICSQIPVNLINPIIPIIPSFLTAFPSVLSFVASCSS